MALRLSDAVIGGELRNNNHYTTHGVLGLRDTERCIFFDLTGNCDPDLLGWHIRFAAQEFRYRDAESVDLSGIAWRQVGPTGTMTASRKVRELDVPADQRDDDMRRDEPVADPWKRSLYLEWFGQNGRVVVELVEPDIEWVEYTDPVTGQVDAERRSPPHPVTGEQVKATNEVDLPEEETGDGPDENDSTAGGFDVSDLEVGDEHDGLFDERPGQTLDDDDELDEDPYGLLPPGLQRQLDAAAESLDQALDGNAQTDDAQTGNAESADAETSEVIRELELIDDCLESGPGVPLVDIFDRPVKLPKPNQLASDEAAEKALKSLLSQLARFGIALDVCKHYSPRDCYRLLVEEICPQEGAYPELKNTQWVQHFSTWEYCEQCELELEREFEEQDREEE